MEGCDSILEKREVKSAIYRTYEILALVGSMAYKLKLLVDLSWFIMFSMFPCWKSMYQIPHISSKNNP